MNITKYLKQFHSLAFILVLFFTLSTAFAHHPDKAFILPTFLFMLLQLTLILSFSKTFDILKEEGILCLYISLGHSTLQKVIHQKMLGEIFLTSLFYAFFSACLLFLWGNSGISNTFFWGVSYFIVSLTTLSLTFLMASLRLSHNQGSFLSLFLIFPLLFPTLLLSLISFDAYSVGSPYHDYFYLNFSLSLVTLGLSFALTPKLIAQAYQT